jgi:tetratricopeptide (TPR) repeat protein
MNLASRKYMPFYSGTLQKNLIKRLYKKKALVLFFASSLPFLSACNQTIQKTDIAPSDQTTIENKTTNSQHIEALLKAEFTLQREGPEKAFEPFYDIADESDDLKIIERLTHIAVASQNDTYVERSANLWLAADPLSEQAYSLKSQVLIKNERTEEAATLFVNAIRHKVSLRFLPLYLEENVRDTEKVEVINNAISEVPDQYQKNQYIQLTQAHIFLLTGQYEQAIALSEQLLARSDSEKSEALYLILAFSQKNLGQLDNAINTLSIATENIPQNARLISPLINLLVEQESIQHAISIYQENTLETSQQLQVGINFIRTLLEHKHPQQALDISNTLPKEQFGFSDQVQFLKAITLAELSDTEQAIEIMNQVGGNLRPSATQQIALWFYDEGEEKHINDMVLNRTLRENIPEQIIIISQLHEEKGNPDLSYELLSRSSDTYPESNVLRYRKALLAETMGSWQTTEAELTILLQKDPSNPQYLNALGYTLLTRTQRIDEAMSYIESAYEKAEDDPAIIDSLGWGHFLKGEYEQATYFLKKAWSILPDAEIAAHYGESLWKQRHYKQAIEIWEKALKSEPNSPLLLDTIKRLSPSLLDEIKQDKTS